MAVWASVLLAMAGAGAVIVPAFIGSQVVYTVTNGTVGFGTDYQFLNPTNGQTETTFILTNTGAVEAGNPQGRVACIDLDTVLDTGQCDVHDFRE